MVLAPGSRLAQYEIVSAVGSGGMGVVYRARDTRLNRDVALKVMAPHIASDPAMRTRFETEARAVASLTHPGILSIYELAVADGMPFAVMELLEGRNLRERIAAGPLPWREAVGDRRGNRRRACRRARQGRRPSRPQARERVPDERRTRQDPRLRARAAAARPAAKAPTVAHTAAGVVLGTFGYMSPEQVTGGQVDGRTDIFALGCLLYEMLTGRQLFTGVTPQELIAKLLHDSRRICPRSIRWRRRGCATIVGAHGRARSGAAVRLGDGGRRGAARPAVRIGRPHAARVAGARQVSRGAAVRQRRRSQARLPDRRHRREHHQQPLAARHHPRRPAQRGVPVQGHAGRSVDDRRGA